MTEKKIKLTTIDDVKDFVHKVNKLDCEADLTIGKYTVDAKSIMGIFSLDLSRQLTLTIHEDNCGAFISEIDRYIIK